MGTANNTLDNSDKVVVGFLDGRRIKGFIRGFSGGEESFDLMLADDREPGKQVKIELKDLKAIFFVQEFADGPDRREFPRPHAPMASRQVEVSFGDGEKIVGRAELHNPPQVGFFIFPAYAGDNNVRIFVIVRNTREIKLL